ARGGADRLHTGGGLRRAAEALRARQDRRAAPCGRSPLVADVAAARVHDHQRAAPPPLALCDRRALGGAARALRLAAALPRLQLVAGRKDDPPAGRRRRRVAVLPSGPCRPSRERDARRLASGVVRLRRPRLGRSPWSPAPAPARAPPSRWIRRFAPAPGASSPGSPPRTRTGGRRSPSPAPSSFSSRPSSPRRPRTSGSTR